LEQDSDCFLAPHSFLPPFSHAPKLWRRLHRQADFYALDGLAAILFVTHVCRRQSGTDKGRLGTNMGAVEYRNPHAIDATSFGGWIDMLHDEQERLRTGTTDQLPSQACTRASRKVFVECRPAIEASPNSYSGCIPIQYLLVQLVVQFQAPLYPYCCDLLTIKLCPTAYSFPVRSSRNETLASASSDNCEDWTVLHQPRKRRVFGRRSLYLCMNGECARRWR